MNKKIKNQFVKKWMKMLGKNDIVLYYNYKMILQRNMWPLGSAIFDKDSKKAYVNVANFDTAYN